MNRVFCILSIADMVFCGCGGDGQRELAVRNFREKIAAVKITAQKRETCDLADAGETPRIMECASVDAIHASVQEALLSWEAGQSYLAQSSNPFHAILTNDAAFKNAMRMTPETKALLDGAMRLTEITPPISAEEAVMTRQIGLQTQAKIVTAAMRAAADDAASDCAIAQAICKDCDEILRPVAGPSVAYIAYTVTVFLVGILIAAWLVWSAAKRR